MTKFTMSISLGSGMRTLRLVLLLITVQCQWFIFTEAKLSVCSQSREGNSTLYRKVSGDDGVLFCIRKSGKYVWKFLDDSSTFGERFDPAKDCSDIVDNVPEAKDGFYWIGQDKKRLTKVWCDVHTDGGGFMLIGMKDSPITGNVPSSDMPVDPTGPPHWSSRFGNVIIQDFAIQISTTKNFNDTKAHWSYRLKSNRALGNLFNEGSAGCTGAHSGIGNTYVKDILTETVVNTKFNCSKFGHRVPVHLGWGRLDSCLRGKCSTGYAYLQGVPFLIRLYNHGSFSYSASSAFSGITHDATAFVGCVDSKCCACFGPKGGRDHYCSKKCTAINGGTILRSQVYVWFWIRTRMPRRVWKRCMEFKMKNKDGKIETHFIDKKTGTPRKGSCSEQFQSILNEGTLLVKNKESLDHLPPVKGIFSYREDNDKFYVSDGDTWEAIGSEKEIKNLTAQVKHLQNNLEKQEAMIEKQEGTIRKEEQMIRKEEQMIRKEDAMSQKQQAVIQKQQEMNQKQQAEIQNMTIIITQLNSRLNAKSLYGSDLNPGKSCKDILATDKLAVSGIYWIQPTTNQAFEVYCDMETHGGGWTLVFSYTFTNYNRFASSGNTITPRPSWPARHATVLISTTPPLSESSVGAVNFNIWKDIGQEFMVKSNINDWLVCKPNVGSLVLKKDGSISCQNIENVATACQGVVPREIYWWIGGPALYANSLYYYFDGHTGGYYPVHDPCGRNQQNQKKGVSNPGGRIYLR